jgi:ABC-2 type transport system ATP-binding protein
LIITDKDAIQHPDSIATLLVQAGCPPVGLIVERGDLESYFLKLVGMKGKNGDE